MRKILAAFVALIFCFDLLAQVAISNPASNPDPSAMLDVKSTNRGFLMPRVTNRANVTSPATGLLVYETATNAVWVYNGTAWVQLGSGGGTTEWLVNGTNIYNGNVGNVGIGTNAPSSKFHLFGNMLMDGTNPTFQLQQAGVDKGFIQLNGDYLRLGTNSANNSGRVVMRLNNVDRVIVDSTGNMRIDGSQDASYTNHGYLMLGSVSGTNLVLDNNEILARNDGGIADLIMQNDGGNVGIGTTPSDKLDINGSVRLTGESRLIKLETGQAGGLITKYAPGMRFIRSDNTLLGAMEYVDTVGTNFLRLRTGSTVSNDFVVTTGHEICIGGSNPNAKLEVRGAGEVMRIHAATDPLLQFSTGNAAGGFGLPLVRKGFLDVNGNDFRIGTNSENNTGNFIVRVNGNESLFIDPSGRVGIHGLPEAKFNIRSGDDASLTSHGYLMLGTVAGSSIVLDNNEIIARGSNGAAGNLVLQNDGGTVRIGSVAVPAGYKFGINGKMICEELKVKLASSGWPDYVFANNYKLRSLPQLEKYIQQNKHLPNIPSAAEVEKNGLEVGDMQKKMMEKIEELTLYVIDLQKQVNELKAKNAVGLSPNK